MAYLQSKRFVLARYFEPDCPDTNTVHSGSDPFIDTTTSDFPIAQAANQASIGGVDEPVEVKGGNEAVQPSHPESLSVVSESDYRCLDESISKIIASERYVI